MESEISEKPAHNCLNGERKAFEVGLLDAKDAEGVAKLFRSVYGEDYPVKIFYDPIELIRANREGDYYTVVARSQSGEVISIHNLFRSAPSREVYEWGGGLVSTQWRNMGVSGAVERYALEKVAPELGMHTVFGEPVTVHVQMQKHCETHRFATTALEVGLMPAAAYSGEGAIAHRVSTLLCFRIYRNMPQKIFIPASYNEAIQFMYGDLSSGRTFAPSVEPIPTKSLSKAHVELFDFAQVVRISFLETGADFDACISQLESEAVEKGSVVVQVWLKLTSPWVGKVVEALQTRGYFIGGVLPQWFDDDGLLMQKLLFIPDFESIQLYSGRAMQIREMVKADWSRFHDRKP